MRIRVNKFAVLPSLGANAPSLFGYLKRAESSPWQSLVPRELDLPATRLLSRCCLDSGVFYALACLDTKYGARHGIFSTFSDRF